MIIKKKAGLCICSVMLSEEKADEPSAHRASSAIARSRGSLVQ